MADYCAILKNANPGAPRRALALHRRAACSTWRAPLPRARARRGFLGGRAGLGERIEVVRGRVEEVALPEACDVLVSEPMGTLLVNERMLETYLFARDHLLKPGGRMFPVRRPSRAPPARAGATHGARGVRGGARRTQRSAPPGPRAASRSWRGTGGVVPGRACARRRRPDAAAPRAQQVGRIHCAVFSDAALFAEVASKAAFWQQDSYYGVDLTRLLQPAVADYFAQARARPRCRARTWQALARRACGDAPNGRPRAPPSLPAAP